MRPWQVYCISTMVVPWKSHRGSHGGSHGGFHVHRDGRTIGLLTVGDFTVTGVPLFLFAFLVSS